MTGAKIEEPKGWICDKAVASIVGGSLMKGRHIQFFITDDVMAVYKIYVKVLNEEFF